MAKWKAVIGYEGIYDVSDRGEVMRVSAARGTAVGHILKPHILKGRGYLQVRLCRAPGDHKSAALGAVVCEAFHGPRPLGMQVNHKNGVKDDNRAANLEWVTPSQNTRHRFDVLKQRNRFGEDHPHAKLSNDDVAQIKALFVLGASSGYVARLFGITRAGVQQIKSGKNWPDILPATELREGLTAQHLPRKSGVAHHNAKLTAKDARAIRSSTELGRVLASKYGVSETAISSIRCGKTWVDA